MYDKKIYAGTQGWLKKASPASAFLPVVSCVSPQNPFLLKKDSEYILSTKFQFLMCILFSYLYCYVFITVGTFYVATTFSSKILKRNVCEAAMPKTHKNDVK